MQIAFIGDISLNDAYLTAVENNENPFQAIFPILSTKDFVVGNLEAVVKNTEKKHPIKQWVLSIDDKCLPLLKKIPVHLLTLANNHIYDQLEDGFRNTIEYLEREKINYCGAYFKNQSSKKVFIQELSFAKIVYLNYVHPFTNPYFPDDCAIEVNKYDKNLIIDDIKKYKNENCFVILIIHWGVDNSKFPAPWQRRHAKQFIKNGADLIIGHHSHVLQGYEKIDNKYIFYSLGNFAFAPLQTDEKIYEMDNKRQRNSIIVNLHIKENFSEVTYENIVLDGLNVVLVKNDLIKKLNRNLPLISNIFIWPFYLFYLKRIYKIYFYFFGNNRNPISQFKKINYNLIKKYFKQ